MKKIAKVNDFMTYLFSKVLSLMILICSIETTFLKASNKETQVTWEEISPFLLPSDFEIKEQLDDLFGVNRVILNRDSLKKAGFTNSKRQDYSLIVVTKHPNFPGFIFKIYLDNESHKSDEKAQYFFLKRVKGALAVQKCIDKYDLGALFKVPKKWIYQLPNYSSQVKKYSHKKFILVEEDMEILSEKGNIKAWKSSLVTEEVLIGLYRIVKEVGLIDCAKIDNIPFSIDGRVAFVDTESYGFKLVPFWRLKEFIPSKKRSFWTKLIKSH